MWGKRLAAVLAIYTSGGVAPEVNLGECISHTPPQSSNKAAPTLALKHRGDVTRSPKQGYQWPKKWTHVQQKFLKRKFHVIRRLCTRIFVVKSVPPLFAVLSLVLCFESKKECNDFLQRATRMLRYSASHHFSRVRYTFSFVTEIFKPWRSWRKQEALSRNGLVS